MEKLKSGPVITNPSILVLKLLLYLSKLGNSFSNKIKANKSQGRKGVRQGLSRAFSGKDQTRKFRLKLVLGGKTSLVFSLEVPLIDPDQSRKFGQELCDPFFFLQGLRNLTIARFSWLVAGGWSQTASFRCENV